MPALPADIAAAIRDAAMAEWASTTIKARYSSARDARTDPSEGYFDLLTDAQTVINLRGALLGTERRRFTIVVADEVWLDPSQGVPTITLTDAEQSVSVAMLVSQIEVDLDASTTTIEVFG